MSRLRRQNTLVIQPIQQHDLPHPGPSTTHPSHPSTANASSSTSRALPTTSEATPATANVVTTTTNSLPDTSPSLQFYADEEAPFDGGASDVRVAVQNLGQKPNILPREMGTLKRADLEAADTVSLKRLAKILMVPHHKSREEIINHIFAQRAVVPKPRKHRSLRVAATEKGIVKRNGIDKGLARPGLKVVKDYNPHKEAISAKARQEMGPQSPVPTDVGSPPPNVADVPEPENRPSCILDKGKGVDRSLDGDNSVAPSPYERPARVPLGRLVPADFSRPGMPTPAESTSDSDDYEPEVIENEVDPTQGEDSRRVYTYPPPNPQSPGWLATMGWRIQQETEGLTQEVDSVRATIDAAVVQGSLTDAELRRVRETYRKLAESIGRVAGPQFMQRLFERALEIEGELEPFEEDTYVDEDRGENQALPVEQYAYNPAEGAQAQG
ncbi:hypothetical protein FKP32DRAFT_1148615 [Trametes sanguinea]|nr:hypothetical protein FKP32DRAFT_1148615 [Trametes sanguinea]